MGDYREKGGEEVVTFAENVFKMKILIDKSGLLKSVRMTISVAVRDETDSAGNPRYGVLMPTERDHELLYGLMDDAQGNLLYMMRSLSAKRDDGGIDVPDSSLPDFDEVQSDAVNTSAVLYVKDYAVGSWLSMKGSDMGTVFLESAGSTLLHVKHTLFNRKAPTVKYYGAKEGGE